MLNKHMWEEAREVNSMQKVWISSSCYMSELSTVLLTRDRKEYKINYSPSAGDFTSMFFYFPLTPSSMRHLRHILNQIRHKIVLDYIPKSLHNRRSEKVISSGIDKAISKSKEI